MAHPPLLISGGNYGVAVTIRCNQNTTISYLYELNKNGGQAPADEDTIMAPPDKPTHLNIAILRTFSSQREMCNGHNWRACNESDSSNNCIADYHARFITPETLQRKIQADFTPIECASMV